MQRCILLIAACCCFLLTSNAQVERKVMIEQFTNASCGPCAAQNPDFNRLLVPNQDRVIALKYQWSFPGYDPMNEQNPGEVNTRISYYSISGVPTAAIDGTVPGNDYGGGIGDWDITPQGGYAGGPYGYNQAVLNYAKAIPTNIAMELDHNLNVALDSMVITCKVKNVGTEAFEPTSGRLHIAITEENINFPEPPGSTNEKDFSHVMRKMIPNAAGTSIDAIAAGDSMVITYAVAIPDYIYNYAELGVVAFVQDHATKEMFQAERSAKKDLPAAGSYFDAAVSGNTITPATLCDLNITPQATVTNAYSATITSFTVGYSINGAALVTQDWTGTLEQGQSVNVNFDQIQIDPGTVSIIYAVGNLNGGAAIDFSSLNNTTPISGFSALSPDPLGTEITYAFENDTRLEFPGDAASSEVDGIGFTFLVVDNSIFQSVSTPLGGYAQSDNSILLDFYQWNPAASGITSATLTLSKVDLSSWDQAYVKMDRAYAQYPGANDRMEVLISTDCGDSWTVINNLVGSALATAPSTQGAFAPTSTQWVTDSIDISSYVGQEVSIGIRATSGWGNLCYLDNINVSGTISTSTGDINLLAGKVNVFPNPSAVGNSTFVEFELTESTPVDINIYDMNGKHVTTLLQGKAFGTGTHLATWKNATQGMYLVKIQTAYGEMTKKLSVF